MAYDKKNKENQYVVILTKNLIGTYEPKTVAKCKPILDYKTQTIQGMKVISTGNKNFKINAGNIIDADEIWDSLNKKEKANQKVSTIITGEKSNYIALVLGDNIKKEIYNKLRAKKGVQVSNEEVELEFESYILKIAKIIKEISYREQRFGKNSYDVSFKDITIDEIESLDIDVIKKIFEAKEEQRQGNIDGTQKGKSINGTATNIQSQNSKEKSEKETEGENNQMSELNSNEIIEELKKKIKGQDKALEDVVSALVLNQNIIGSDIEDANQYKTNILIDGPSGTGKTYIIENVAKALGLPCYVTGITNYSGVGYSGADLKDILLKLLIASNGDLELAQKGIVAMDEFDKLSVDPNDDVKNNATHQAIQDELLTYMSGTKVDVVYNGMNYEFDTSNLSFIAMGAFDRMHKSKIAENEQRIQESPNDSQEVAREYDITKEDYINEGLRRELLGRFQSLTHTNELGIEELKDILLNSENSRLKKIKLIESIYGKKIEVADETIDYIVQDAFRNNTGARALGDSIENIISILNKQINDPSIKNISVTKEIAEKALKAQRYQYIDPEARNIIGREMD